MILCPVDFSDQSRQALEWAVAIAVRRKRPLTVMTSVEPILADAARVRFDLDLVESETRPELRDFVAAVVPEGASWAPRLAYDVRVGESAEVILQAARELDAELIVLGTQGLGGVRKWLLGSTAERVLRGTTRPVLAVPRPADASVVVDAAGARFELGRILAATDFSRASRRAVEAAARLSGEVNTPLVLVHAVEPVSAPPQWESYRAGAAETLETQARARLAREQEEACAGRPCETVVATGRAADAIAATAEARGAGLIVLGLTGAQQANAPRPGSTAYRVLVLSRVPVLVVPDTV